MFNFSRVGSLRLSTAAMFLLGALIAWGAAQAVQQRKIRIVVDCPSITAPPARHALLTCAGIGAPVKAHTDAVSRGAHWIEVEAYGDFRSSGSAMLKSLEGDATQELVFAPAPVDQWTRQRFAVSDALRQGPFRLVAVAQPGGPSQIGIGLHAAGRSDVDFVAIAQVLAWLAFIQFMVTELAWAFSRKLGGADGVLASLLGIGALSFVAFWAYLVSHRAGIWMSTGCALGLLAHALWRRATNLAADGVSPERLLGMVGWFTLFVFIVGLFPYGTGWDGWEFPANRWRGMPIDNWLPKVFADQLWNMKLQIPMFGDWLSSDRPPLQTGAYLLIKGLAARESGLYQVMGMWLQASFLIPSILILRRLVPARAMTLATLVVALSATMMINTLFIWPKLIAATYTAIFFLVLTQRDVPATWRTGMVAGIAAGLAMLSHGGATFALAGIGLWWVVTRRMRGIPVIATALVATIVVYGPWIYYQHAIDPPGNRLIVWHIAGFVPIQTGTTMEIIQRGYANVTLHDWFDGKLVSLSKIVMGSVDFFTDIARYAGSFVSNRTAPDRPKMIEFSFYYISYAMWWLSPVTATIGLILCAVRRKRLPPGVGPLAATVALTLPLWTIALYKSGDTLIHQGAYFVPMAMMFLSMAITCCGSFRLFAVAGGLNILTCLALLVGPARDAHWETSGIYYVLVALALAALAASARAIERQPYAPLNPSAG